MQPISAVADIKASTKGSWHEFDLTRIRTQLRVARPDRAIRLGRSPYLAHLSYKRDQIKWEVLWTGGLPIPHLHDNRPFKTIAFFAVLVAIVVAIT